jgi:hypothetical protein
LLFLTAGCSNGIKNEGNRIVVEKQVDQTDNYKYYNEVTNSKEVQKAKNILQSIKWENAYVNMAYPPHYKFHFEGTDENQKSDKLVYELWISPNKDKIELVIAGEGKYVQLSKDKSNELFKIIAGNELNEV